MKKLLVLALILVSASAFAQTSNMPNGIGVYFDQNGHQQLLCRTAPMLRGCLRLSGGDEHHPVGHLSRLGG